MSSDAISPDALSSSPPVQGEDIQKNELSDFDSVMQNLHYWMTNKVYPPGLNGEEKRAVRRTFNTNKYSLDRRTSTLYYEKEKGKKKAIVVTDESMRKDLLWQTHSSSTGAHSGINATRTKITSAYFWKGVKAYVEEFISRCDECQRYEKIKTMAPELQSIPVTGTPLDMVGMDLIGPLPTTKNGCQYVLTMTDYYTKFIDLFPIDDKCAATVSLGVTKFITRWGVPRKLLSDRGTEFVNSTNDALAARFGIKRMVTSAYHPQTNGLDERTNKTLKTRVGKLTNKDQDDWDELLDEVAFSMRIQKQASTKHTPFFLMFNRHPRLPIEMVQEQKKILTEAEIEACLEPTDEVVDAYVELVRQIADETKTKVLENIAKAQAKQKKEYAKKKSKGVKQFELKVGDEVLRKDMRKAAKRGKTMKADWTGPYIILSIDTSQRLQIKSKESGVELKDRFPYAQFKPYKRKKTCIKNEQNGPMDSTPQAPPPQESPSLHQRDTTPHIVIGQPSINGQNPENTTTTTTTTTPPPQDNLKNPSTTTQRQKPEDQSARATAVKPKNSLPVKHWVSILKVVPDPKSVEIPDPREKTPDPRPPATTESKESNDPKLVKPVETADRQPPATTESKDTKPVECETPNPRAPATKRKASNLQANERTPRPKRIRVPNLGVARVLTSCRARTGGSMPVTRLPALITSPSIITGMIAVINKKCCLTDEEINHGQALLKRAHPHVDSLQIVNLFAEGCSLVGTPTEPFVQIVHAFKNHWICLSNIGCPQDHIRIYDSIWCGASGRTSPQLLKQIGWLMYTTQLFVEWPYVQTQKGNKDCGIFALAVATALCNGHDPTTIAWDQPKMRRHLSQAFRSGTLAPFPALNHVSQNRPAKIENVPVVCHCRQPTDKRKLLECLRCKCKFHRTCDKNVNGVAFVCVVCRGADL